MSLTRMRVVSVIILRFSRLTTNSVKNGLDLKQLRQNFTFLFLNQLMNCNFPFSKALLGFSAMHAMLKVFEVFIRLCPRLRQITFTTKKLSFDCIFVFIPLVLY